MTWVNTWADVWVKEDGEWKVAAIYVIDSKKLAMDTLAVRLTVPLSGP